MCHLGHFTLSSNFKGFVRPCRKDTEGKENIERTVQLGEEKAKRQYDLTLQIPERLSYGRSSQLPLKVGLEPVGGGIQIN